MISEVNWNAFGSVNLVQAPSRTHLGGGEAVREILHGAVAVIGEELLAHAGIQAQDIFHGVREDPDVQRRRGGIVVEIDALRPGDEGAIGGT